MVTRVFSNQVPVLKLAPSPPPPLVEAPACCAGAIAWPTRARLIDIFGSDEMVNRALASLMDEAREDNALLDLAQARADASLVVERLHRLVGSLAFVGGVDLERRAEQLIARVQARGVVANMPQLQVFQRNLRVYIAYLSRL
ncbi:hypothetical protein FBY10_101425 [Pseudomonas sp. SJZ103]|jgi:HPt (histidine-containing phosphotransfer) domain-containing protein|uniref:Hpt domain-containing protein n=2 Tax=unclassified Pseudomonas TaxID=196821 RepID=UPI00103CD49B|nr:MULTISPECIES: Hpt domain-containing protein [unclassified Pseudomonas]TWC74722.1 hypothetical protein FBY10_101425 [Pseudomonas sp. SJZ103]TWC93149.1 hypothetical protein FBY08_101633 [Pseudomonas sp. SJZ094]